MLRKQLYWLLSMSIMPLVLLGCPSDSEQNNSNNTSCTFSADCGEGKRCDNGTCTTQTQACTSVNDCNFDEYCAGGTCKLSTCSQDTDCVGDSVICDGTSCREGCRENADCGEGRACNSSNTCEAAGCTPLSCVPTVETCDTTQQPSVCIPNGKCGRDVDCSVYSNYLGDGEQRICGAGGDCVIKPPCQSDTDCKRDEGEICVAGPNDRNICRKGCRDDGQCAANEFCDTDMLSCIVGCASDADCSAVDPNKDFTCSNLKCIEICENADSCLIDGQICAPKMTGEPRVCHGCNEDSQCALTQFCDKTKGSNDEERNDPGVGLCTDLPPECPDDGYGNNHAFERAYELTTFPFVADGMASPKPDFCDQNRLEGEWFKVQADVGKVITIEANYEPVGANLDLELLRSDGTLIIASKNTPDRDGGTEKIYYGVSTGDNFYIKLTGSLSNKKRFPYTLKVNVADPEPCVDDMFEENDTLATAAEVMPSTAANGLQVCASIDQAKTDRDFYKLNILANQVVSIAAIDVNKQKTLSIVVTDEMGAPVTTTVFNDNTVQFATMQAGVYVVEVAVTSGVGNITYDFEWRQRDNECADAYEPNDGVVDAKSVGAGLITDLNLCTDEDWYVVDLLPLQTLTVHADYNPSAAQGFIEIRLRGPNNPATIAKYDVRESLPGGFVRQKVELQAQQGGKFYVVVTRDQGLNVPYTLDVQLQDGPACGDDTLEPNDDLGGAYSIDPALAALGTGNALIGLRYCDLNNDFYSIALAENDKIEWVVKHTVANGDLDAEIVGPLDGSGMGPVVAVGTGVADDETVTYTVPAGKAGTYVLRVFGKNALRTNYRVLTYLNEVGPTDPDCPDLYENNDTRMTAKNISAGSYDLLVCGQPVDDDWFTTCIEAGETLKVDVNLDHSRGNIDLYLYDDSGGAQFLAFSNTLTNLETVSATTSRDQCFTYKINTFSNVPSNTYTMDVSVIPAPTCVEDRFESNDTAATATPVNAPGLYRDLSKCEDNDDWFSFQVRENQKAEVYANFDLTKGDIDLQVFSSPGAMTPTFSGTTTTAGESVVFTAPDDTNTNAADTQTFYTYYVKVITKTRARLGYDLLTYLDTNNDGTVEGPEDRLCPDLFEQNDTRTTAKPFPIGTQGDLSLCWQGGTLNDNDYYSVFVPSGATLTVDVRFAHDQGNLDVEIFRGQLGGAVAFARSSDDDETAMTTNAGTGETYVVRVYGSGVQRFTTSYSLEIGLSFADVCSEDAVSGDDKAGALTISTNSYPDMALCEGSEDWMKFTATNNQRIIASIEVNNLFGDVDLQLLDSSDTVIAESVLSGASVETIDVNAPSAGTYYLRVFPKGGSFIRNYYDLWFQLGNTPPTAPFCPDAYERNDTPTSAAALNFSATPQYTDMIACGADRDWYAVSNLSSNSDYNVAVFFDQGAGQQLDLDIKNDMGTSVATGTTGGNDELLTFRPPASGTYYVGVENKSATPTGAPYYMFFNSKNASCKEDIYEPNNTPAQATLRVLDMPGTYALGSCNNDDYFTVKAANTGTMKLTLYYNSTDLQVLMRGTDFARNALLNATNSTNRSVINVPAVTAGDNIELYIGQIMGSGAYFLKIEN